ncbi:MAG: hypothetical protein ACE5HO_15885 [bacterium]
MISKPNSQTLPWLGLATISVAALLLAWFSPEERTLGPGIKIVYIHVAFIWSGMLGLTLSGALGLLVLLTDNRRLQGWSRSIGWVALAFFTVGLALSLLASQINWGAVFWHEPRMVAALKFLVVALLIFSANLWIPWHRLQGLLHALLATYLMWSILGTPLVLHPQSPIRASESLTIQLTFLGMFVLCCLAAAIVIWFFRRKEVVI